MPDKLSPRAISGTDRRSPMDAPWGAHAIAGKTSRRPLQCGTPPPPCRRPARGARPRQHLPASRLQRRLPSALPPAGPVVSPEKNPCDVIGHDNASGAQVCCCCALRSLSKLAKSHQKLHMIACLPADSWAGASTKGSQKQPRTPLDHRLSGYEACPAIALCWAAGFARLPPSGESGPSQTLKRRQGLPISVLSNEATRDTTKRIRTVHRDVVRDAPRRDCTLAKHTQWAPRLT